MKLLFVIPDGVAFEKRAKLSGEDSAGQASNEASLDKSEQAKDNPWYGPNAPAKGWEAVATAPDPQRTAQ